MAKVAPFDGNKKDFGNARLILQFEKGQKDFSMKRKQPHTRSSEDGFIPGASLIFSTNSNTQDYHQDMNTNTFLKWFDQQLLPNLKDESLIVMDNAPYHQKRIDPQPTKSSKKTDILEWMTRHDICHTAQDRKEDLLQKIKMANIDTVYCTDVAAAAMGHSCIRLPPYHCELNPIELVQGQEKNIVAKKNKYYKLNKVKELFVDARNEITTKVWADSIQHVIKNVEDVFWKDDGVGINVQEGTAVEVDVSESESDSCVNESETEECTMSQNVPPPNNNVPGMEVCENEVPGMEVCEDDVCAMCCESMPVGKDRCTWMQCDFCDS